MHFLMYTFCYKSLIIDFVFHIHLNVNSRGNPAPPPRIGRVLYASPGTYMFSLTSSEALFRSNQIDLRFELQRKAGSCSQHTKSTFRPTLVRERSVG